MIYPRDLSSRTR